MAAQVSEVDGDLVTGEAGTQIRCDAREVTHDLVFDLAITLVTAQGEVARELPVAGALGGHELFGEAHQPGELHLGVAPGVRIARQGAEPAQRLLREFRR